MVCEKLPKADGDVGAFDGELKPPNNDPPDAGLEVETPLSPNKFVFGVFALPKGDAPKLFDGEADVAPPNIDDVLVVPELPPKIFEAGFDATDPNKLSDADKPKLATPNIFDDCCADGDKLAIFVPKTLVAVLVDDAVLALFK